MIGTFKELQTSGISIIPITVLVDIAETVDAQFGIKYQMQDSSVLKVPDPIGFTGETLYLLVNGVVTIEKLDGTQITVFDSNENSTLEMLLVVDVDDGSGGVTQEWRWVEKLEDHVDKTLSDRTLLFSITDITPITSRPTISYIQTEFSKDTVLTIDGSPGVMDENLNKSFYGYLAARRDDYPSSLIIIGYGSLIRIACAPGVNIIGQDIEQGKPVITIDTRIHLPIFMYVELKHLGNNDWIIITDSTDENTSAIGITELPENLGIAIETPTYIVNEFPAVTHTWYTDGSGILTGAI